MSLLPYIFNELDDALNRPFKKPYTTFTRPRCDIIENDTSYTIIVDVPGCKKENLKVMVENKTLKVMGKRENDYKQDNQSYYYSERSYGEFQRSFSLPDGIDDDGVSAQHDNGVLTITIPKKNPKANNKAITIE